MKTKQRNSTPGRHQVMWKRLSEAAACSSSPLTLHSQHCRAFIRTSRVGSHTGVGACVRRLQEAQLQSADIFRKAGLAFRSTNDLISILKPADRDGGRARDSALQNHRGPQSRIGVFQLADEGRRHDSIYVEKGSFVFTEELYFTPLGKILYS